VVICRDTWCPGGASGSVSVTRRLWLWNEAKVHIGSRSQSLRTRRTKIRKFEPRTHLGMQLFNFFQFHFRLWTERPLGAPRAPSLCALCLWFGFGALRQSAVVLLRAVGARLVVGCGLWADGGGRQVGWAAQGQTNENEDEDEATRPRGLNFS